MLLLGAGAVAVSFGRTSENHGKPDHDLYIHWTISINSWTSSWHFFIYICYTASGDKWSCSHECRIYSWCPLVRGLGGHQGRSGRGDEEKNICGSNASTHSIRSAVILITELSWILHRIMSWLKSNDHRRSSVSIKTRGNDEIFSLHHCAQTGSGAYPASYPMGNRGSFPGGKAAGAWSWPLTSI